MARNPSEPRRPLAHVNLGRPNRDFPVPQNYHVEIEPEVDIMASQQRKNPNDPLQFKNPNHFSGLFENLQKQREEGRLQDCEILVGDQRIAAHKCVLAAFCPTYFDTMLRFEEARQGQEQQGVGETSTTFDLLDLNVRSVEMILDYAYRGDITITRENISDVLQTADFLNVVPLIDACIKYLTDGLTVDNCFATLRHAISMNNSALNSSAVVFIARHFTELSSREDFFQIDPKTLLEIIKSDELVVTETFTYDSKTTCTFFVEPSRQEQILLDWLLSYKARSMKQGIDAFYGKFFCQVLSEGVRLPLIKCNVLEGYNNHMLIASEPECLQTLNRAMTLSQVIAPRRMRYLESHAAESVLLGRVSEGSEEQAFRKDIDLVELSSCGSWDKPRSLSGVLKFHKTSRLASNNPANFHVVSDFDDSLNDQADHLTDHQQTEHFYPPGPVQFVTGMKLYMRRWDDIIVIGGILVTYNHGWFSSLHSSDNYGYEVEEFSLAANERITGIDAQAGWMVDGLTFTTSSGRKVGPYGGNGGSAHSFEPPHESGYLAYLTGNVETTENLPAVRQLQFVWAYNSANLSAEEISSFKTAAVPQLQYRRPWMVGP